MSFGYEWGADLPGVTEQSVCMGIHIVLLVSLLLVECYRRSHARKSDSDVAGGDPFSLMLVGLLCNYRDGVPQSIYVA